MWCCAFCAGLLTAVGAFACESVRLLAPLVFRRAVGVTDAGTVTLSAPGEAPVLAGRLATFLIRRRRRW